MRTTTCWMRIVAALAAVVMLAGGAAFVPPPANTVLAQASSFGDVELYQSEQFGWFMFYDASAWEIEEESSAPGSDYVRFSDGEAFASYVAFDAPGTTPGQCIEAVLEDLAENPGILEIEAMTESYEEIGEDGLPTITYFETPFGASTALVLTVDGDTGPFKLVTFEHCRLLDGATTLLHSSNYERAVTWNVDSRTSRPVIVEHLPVNDISPYNPPAELLDADGSLQGLLDLKAWCTAEFYVLARNMASIGNVVINPSAFVGIDATSGNPAPLTFSGYTYPSIPTDLSMALPPGGVGLLAFEMEPPFKLYFETPSEETILVGSHDPACGAGSGAPVVIEIE